MELLCIETDNIVKAQFDPVILDDPRVLMRLLDLEKEYTVTENYFDTVQSELTPNMRRICLSWLLEVCDNERCEDVSFPLAANLMDRYLSIQRVNKSNLQLLACVCLMLATKLRQTKPVTSGLLAAYTDHTYSILDIVNWETEVLNALKWKLASVTPHDYLDTVLYRMPSLQQLQNIVQSHAKTFQQLCTLEFEFAFWPSSLIALSTIGAAVRGLPNIENIWPPVKNLAKIFNEITEIEVETIENCILYMENFVNKYINSAKKKQAEAFEQTEALARKRDVEFISDDNPDTPPDVKDVKF